MNLTIYGKTGKQHCGLFQIDMHNVESKEYVRNATSPWVNQHLKKEMYARDILKKKATKSNSSADWLHFKEKRTAVNQLMKKSKKSYYQDEIKNNSGNPKGTWKALNSLMGKKTKSSEIPK